MKEEEYQNIENEENNSGYQSREYEKKNTNETEKKNQENNNTTTIPTDYNKYLKCFELSKNKENIPTEPTNFFSLFLPSLEKYEGIGLVKHYYYLLYFLIVIVSIITYISTIIGIFIYQHWAIGLVSIFFNLIMTVISLFVSLATLRIISEVLISIFVIRNKLDILSRKRNK
jgi:CBS domain containing-hemolysin-like protein